MADFTKEQQKAIMHVDGPMLVLAGPGSGKTTVITNRIRFLTEEVGVAAGNILVITFTKAAALEMEERYKALAPNQKNRVNFGTFHAVFFKILRMTYRLDASNILKEEERSALLKEIILSKIDPNYTDEKDILETIGAEISLVKNERYPLDTYYSANCPDEVFRDIFTEYQQRLHKMNKLDFDDMLLECYRLLCRDDKVLRSWQDKYRYIMIDEFQDINYLQYDVIKMLAAPENNLFIVGDDDQSIYGFRGAKPELMMRFTEDFKQAGKITLSCNFRSTGPIVSAALRLIGYNQKRFEKKLYAEQIDGEAVEIRTYTDRKQQSAELAEEIASLHKAGLAWREMAVLFRTNLQTRMLMGKLNDFAIPFQTRENVPNLFDHWICKDICAYIKLALGQRERGLFYQIMNRPKRYLSRESVETPVLDFERMKKYYEGKDYVTDRIEKLEYDFSMIRGLNPFAAVNYIRRAVGYDGFLTEYAAYRRMSAEDLFDVLADIQDDAAEYQSFDSWFAHMDEYKEMLRLQKARNQKEGMDAVTLTTYHSAKGLEYHTVFLPELCEDMTPYRQAVKPEDLEEERRMFYVAMTRAKRRLVLSSLKELRMNPLKISRFIREAMWNKETFSVGTKVVHKIYGNGTVVSEEEERVTVSFENAGTRVLNASYCLENGILKKEK